MSAGHDMIDKETKRQPMGDECNIILQAIVVCIADQRFEDGGWAPALGKPGGLLKLSKTCRRRRDPQNAYRPSQGAVSLFVRRCGSPFHVGQLSPTA